jgi:uncharacterized protein
MGRLPRASPRARSFGPAAFRTLLTARFAMPLLAVSAHELDAAGRSIQAALPAEWLEQHLSDAGLHAQAPGRVAVRLTRSGTDVVVRGRVDAKVVTRCARCTEPAEISIGSDLSLLLQARPDKPPVPAVARPAKATGQRLAPAPAKAGGGSNKKKPRDKEPEQEFSADDADVDTYDGETVVLDAFIREAILLEMPIFPLCSEDCPGIRPGASEAAVGKRTPSVDPRLAPLGALRDKLERAAPAAAPKTSPKGGASPPVAHATRTKKTKNKE